MKLEVEAYGRDNIFDQDSSLPVLLQSIVCDAEQAVWDYPQSSFTKSREDVIVKEITSDYAIEPVILSGPQPHQIEEDGKDCAALQSTRFTGDPRLLWCSSLRYGSFPPAGHVISPDGSVKGEIKTRISIPGHLIDSGRLTRETIAELFEKNTQRIEEHIDHANNRVKSHNENLPEHVRAAVKLRLDRLEKADSL